MKADLQSQIAPPKVANVEQMSDAKVKRNDSVKDSTGPKDEIDFKSVLFNSNMDTKRTREAKKNGDLTADTHEEFLEKLAEQTKQERVPKNKLDKDDFLKLFVTQLQHQDPLNPDDGAEMAAKLAQFNSLEQLMNVNKALEKMATAESTNRNMMLSSFIGKDIQVSGGRTRLSDDKLAESKFELIRGAKNATLQVRDTSGILIREQELGSLAPGQHTLQWDGKNRKGEQAPEGIYTFSVMALDAEGKDIPINISSSVKVMGVDINDQGGGFYTDYGRVSLDQVKAVGEQGFYQYNHNAVKDKAGAEADTAGTDLAAAQAATLAPKRPPMAKNDKPGATAKDIKEIAEQPVVAESDAQAVKKESTTKTDSVKGNSNPVKTADSEASTKSASS